MKRTHYFVATSITFLLVITLVFLFWVTKSEEGSQSNYLVLAPQANLEQYTLHGGEVSKDVTVAPTLVVRP